MRPIVSGGSKVGLLAQPFFQCKTNRAFHIICHCKAPAQASIPLASGYKRRSALMYFRLVYFLPYDSVVHGK
jgi:hypothetical protein